VRSKSTTKRAKPRSKARRILASLGPGVITGAADDDPSGIATYSIAGASLGFSLLWSAGLSWPLMAFVQMTCARVGMVTGQGLAVGLKRRFWKGGIAVVASALFLANTINIAADLAGMADAAAMVLHVPPPVGVLVFAAVIAWLTVTLRYEQISRVLKWLALALFLYVLVALRVAEDWGEILKAAVLPHWPRKREEWGMLVAILGTTISPYLFFWQASQEVEEEKAAGLKRVEERRGTTSEALSRRRWDVGIGTFFSNFVMFFVIVATALTLHRHGVTHPKTSADIARALEPVAGKFTELLYALGLIGVGLLAIPTLSGSAAYAFAETFGWRQGLDRSFKGARAFYVVVILATVLGAAVDFAHISPVAALYWSAVINGILAPFLLVGILVLASNRKLMLGKPIPIFSRVVVGITCAVMFAAAIAMVVF
jgi:NRAMP (natural resistance-associated macrophage protein)-like metal ion transporter